MKSYLLLIIFVQLYQKLIPHFCICIVLVLWREYAYILTLTLTQNRLNCSLVRWILEFGVVVCNPNDAVHCLNIESNQRQDTYVHTNVVVNKLIVVDGQCVKRIIGFINAWNEFDFNISLKIRQFMVLYMYVYNEWIT